MNYKVNMGIHEEVLVDYLLVKVLYKKEAESTKDISDTDWAYHLGQASVAEELLKSLTVPDQHRWILQ